MIDTKSFLLYGINQGMAKSYATQVGKHIECVGKAGIKLEKQFEMGLTKEQLADHDCSKWDLAEFPHYALHFHGEKFGLARNPPKFERAWLHHIHNNPHHWQHWMFPDGFKLDGGEAHNGIIKMPENYLLEMVADWQGGKLGLFSN
jgi:hypothetical protein